jgi:hypothetical protein
MSTRHAEVRCHVRIGNRRLIAVEKLTQLERDKLLEFSERVRPTAAQRAEFAALREAWKRRQMHNSQDR